MGTDTTRRDNKNRELECIIVLKMSVNEKKSFFQYKEELNQFSLKVKEFTNQSEQAINQKFSKQIRNCAGLVYDGMRFRVDCKIGKFTGKEIECKRAYGTVKLKSCLGISDTEQISYKRLYDEVKRRGEPVLAFLEQYKAGILDLYQHQVPFLWHVSAVPNIKVLNSSSQRENMYYNDICGAVFAVSSYDEILLYLGRALGDEMSVIDDFCFYKKRPYYSWDSCTIQLKEPAAVYYLDIDGFLPVIDFVMTNSGKASLKFDHEWIHKGDVPVSIVEEVKTIPAGDMLMYHLFYGLKNVCLAPYVDCFKRESRLHKRKAYLQKLVDDKIIAYINLL